MTILGIESSCDETAAAIVVDGKRLIASAVQSQIDIHTEYGGVVPEIAARSHIEAIHPVIRRVFHDSGLGWDNINAIAVANTPGLIGSLLVGVLTARTLAVVHNKPLYPVHHVEGHVYANFIVEQVPSLSLPLPTKQPEFPMLALAVSGLHTQLVYFTDHGTYRLLGQTLDDAIGEAYDKVAKILGLGYPGGPQLEKWAKDGDARAYSLPIARLPCPPGCTHILESTATPAQGRQKMRASVTSSCRRYDFSFSGLKTAVLRAAQAAAGKDFTFPSHELAELLDDVTKHNLAASFVAVAVETLVGRTVQAYQDLHPVSVVIAGGVAASPPLRQSLAKALPIPIEYAPMSLCTDNAAMIASLGYYHSLYTQPTDPHLVEALPSTSMEHSSWRK
jgi:N6-L-threonylcarbamoyladenine synthase